MRYSQEVGNVDGSEERPTEKDKKEWVSEVLNRRASRGGEGQQADSRGADDDCRNRNIGSRSDYY